MEALSVIRAELLVAVLTAPTLQEVISDARVPASAKAVLNDRIQSQRQLKVLSANRLCQGITMFNYVDTSPGVGEEACGIRIEIFDRSEYTRLRPRFSKPRMSNMNQSQFFEDLPTLIMLFCINQILPSLF